MTDDKPEYATGGPISPGNTYWIGEDEPEPFILPTSVRQRMAEVRDAIMANLGTDTSPCGCVITRTSPDGQVTPITYNIDTSACDKHRESGYGR